MTTSPTIGDARRESSEPMSEFDALRFVRYAACIVCCGDQYQSAAEKAWFREFVRTYGLPEICEVDEEPVRQEEHPKPDLHMTFTNMQSVVFEVSFGPMDLRP